MSIILSLGMEWQPCAVIALVEGAGIPTLANSENHSTPYRLVDVRDGRATYIRTDFAREWSTDLPTAREVWNQPMRWLTAPGLGERQTASATVFEGDVIAPTCTFDGEVLTLSRVTHSGHSPMLAAFYHRA